MVELNRLDDLYQYGIKLLESLEDEFDSLTQEREAVVIRNRQLISDITIALERYTESGADYAEKR